MANSFEKNNLSGTCSKCQKGFDLLSEFRKKYGIDHVMNQKANFPDGEKVCLSCRLKNASFEAKGIICLNCIFYGYSSDSSDGRGGKCANCVEWMAKL